MSRKAGFLSSLFTAFLAMLLCAAVTVFLLSVSYMIGAPATASKEAMREETLTYLNEAAAFVNANGLEVTLLGQGYSYNEANVEAIDLELTDEPEIACADAFEEGSDAVPGGCVFRDGLVMKISTAAGSGEALKALVLHEFAHYLQFSHATPGGEPLLGDKLPAYECFADELAVQLGAKRDLLSYTLTGECTHTSLESSYSLSTAEKEEPKNFFEKFYESVNELLAQD